jgi:SAM-dependent methyltransferase
MRKEEYDRLFQVEDRHWWYRGTRRFFLDLLAAYCPGEASGRVLDAGCGTGGFLAQLRERFRPREAVGLDLCPEALEMAGRRGLEGLCLASLEDIPFPDGHFTLVSCLDVLCHREVRDEGRALGELWRVLEPGGFLLLNLPAFGILRGSHDRAVHVARRYRKISLLPRLEASGFRVVKATYFNFLLFPAMVAYRLASRILPSPSSDLWTPPTFLNRWLEALLVIEGRVALQRDLPWGSSLAVLARREGW